jgi:DNA mismatch repair protein MutL
MEKEAFLMSEIKLLSPKVISKIAAGEVVERPASVLKELLENSIDSGATVIKIDIEKAGKKLIRVNDNGKGMSGEDLNLSIERHSTSKISEFEDLDSLITFGFRGEALYSITAVSKTKITSATETEKCGHSLEIEGGKTVSKSEAPKILGTTVEVRDLFFNVPARAKFLKGDLSERSHLIKVVEDCALAYPEITFHLRIDGRDIYVLQGSGLDRKSAIVAKAQEILGKDIAKTLEYEEDNSGPLKMYLTRPQNLVATRGMQFFFINRRPVTSKVMQQAMYKAFEGMRQGNKHPVCIVYMELPPSEFDVNIHPQKKDVRFRNESFIYKQILGLASKIISQSTNAFETPAKPIENISNGGEGVFAQTKTPSPLASSLSSSKEEYQSEKPQVLNLIEKEKGPKWWNPPYRYLGQIEKSYLVFESGDGMLVIDQHAAQERLLFENYIYQISNGKAPVQPLMLPVNIEMSASSIENILKWRDWLNSAGFEFERFGPTTLIVRSIPVIFDFNDDNLRELFEKLSEVLGDPQKCSEEVKRETVAMMACKKSIKAHDKISSEEAQRLLKDLKECKNPGFCPHGRPTMFSMTRSDILKKFHRTS